MGKSKRKAETRNIDDVDQREEKGTMDIYDDEQREEMLEDGEITGTESAFMEGREMKFGKRKKGSESEHEDTTSVELAKQEYT